MFKIKSNKKGLAAVEYGLGVAALLAVLAIAIVPFKDKMDGVYTSVIGQMPSTVIINDGGVSETDTDTDTPRQPSNPRLPDPQVSDEF